MSLGQENDTKTYAHRTVQLFVPLAEDLLEWRMRSGCPASTALVFRVRSVCGRRRPLRHSFASLLLHEGRSVVFVARQLGNDARVS
jgi:hypothetical protein